MWYAPYWPPLALVSPFVKLTLASSIVAASGAPVAASVTWPCTGIGRWSTARIPGHTSAASAIALSYGGWNSVWVSIRNAYAPIRANCHC